MQRSDSVKRKTAGGRPSRSNPLKAFTVTEVVLITLALLLVVRICERLI